VGDGKSFFWVIDFFMLPNFFPIDNIKNFRYLNSLWSSLPNFFLKDYDMKCPFCRHLENKVIDSRMSKDGSVIRRRRECLACQRRFTTHERIEEIMPMVIKKDGGREPFDRNKILGGIQKACQKRPISAEDMEATVSRIEEFLQEKGEKELPSSVIGEKIMQELHALDEVAYVRFASVYRSFKDLTDFMSEVKELLGTREKEKKS
jgi:transcriptional repressor NrdR